MPQALLLMAHPGHELLLHHWMERHCPMVFAMTDGSGGAGASRVARSTRIIEAAGGTIGPRFGSLSDAAWYQAILARNAAPFRHLIDSATAPSARTQLVVSDPIEYFNPLHDLCCVVAHSVKCRMDAQNGRQTRHLEHAIEAAAQGAPEESIQLDGAALARKRAAIDSYGELHSETERKRSDAILNDLSGEALFPARCVDMWPQDLQFEPYYETFGRMRVTSGLYSDVITYSDHVRPLAMQLLDQAASGGA